MCSPCMRSLCSVYENDLCSVSVSQTDVHNHVQWCTLSHTSLYFVDPEFGLEFEADGVGARGCVCRSRIGDAGQEWVVVCTYSCKSDRV